MDLKLDPKIIRDMSRDPERFEFRIVDKNVTLFRDNVATSYKFAISEREISRIKYIRSYKIKEDVVQVKAITI